MPMRISTNQAHRAQFLEDAAQILSRALGIAMAPNGSRAASNNRMGTFRPKVKVGVVATAEELRVHLHSKQPAHHREFRAIVAELGAGTLGPEGKAQGALSVVTRNAPRETATDLLYLEHAWPPRDLRELDLGSVEALAAWLILIRPRF